MKIAWYKIDDQLHSHPKARRAGLEAMGLWTLAGSHCMSYLTDGFVEEWFVQSWPHGPELAAKLVSVGLWVEAEGGWQFHDWDKYQPTRASVKAERDAAAERMRKVRANRSPRSGEQAANKSRSSASPSPSPSPDLLLTDLVGLGSKRARDETDSEESEEQVEACLRLAARHGLDLQRIIELAKQECGRHIGHSDALRLGQHIAGKSKRRLANPMSYVAAAFKHPAEVQQWIDTEVIT